jgi:hypothetical protein
MSLALGPNVKVVWIHYRGLLALFLMTTQAHILFSWAAPCRGRTVAGDAPVEDIRCVIVVYSLNTNE